MLKNMKASFADKYSKVKFKAKKNSPEILIILGIGGVICATVMACKASMKLPEIMDDLEEELEEIDDREKTDEKVDDETFNKEIKHDTFMAYFHAGVKVVKIFALPVGIGSLSIASILASYGIIRTRYIGMAAYATAINNDLNNYRGGVIERFGEEVDKQLRTNTHTEEIEETVTNDKGKEKTVKKEINVADPNVSSPYMKYFTRLNPDWIDDPEQMAFFFKARQSYLNDKLRVKHHLTLNEAYVAFNFKETKAGMVCGWLDNSVNGDRVVQLDIKEVCLPTEDGRYEMAYAIDFNVDGSIYDDFV